MVQLRPDNRGPTLIIHRLLYRGIITRGTTNLEGGTIHREFLRYILANATLCHRKISQILLQKVFLEAENKLHEIRIPIDLFNIKIKHLKGNQIRSIDVFHKKQTNKQQATTTKNNYIPPCLGGSCPESNRNNFPLKTVNQEVKINILLLSI